MRKTLYFTSCLAAAALATAAPALAQMAGPQPRPERPYRGLFGGGVGSVEQQLTVDFSLGGGYDDDLAAEAGSPGQTDPLSSPARRGGPFGSMSTGLSYGLGLERVSFNANYGMSGRYYRDLPSNFLAGHSVGAGVSFQATDSLSLVANYSMSYQPFYSAAFIPPVFDPALGALSLADLSIAYLRESYFGSSTGVSVSQQLGGRTSVSGSYSYQASGVLLDDGFATQAYGVSLSHGIGRGLAARLGYSANEALYADEVGQRRLRYQSIDAGLDFSKSLSLTRRTSLAFSTGTTAANGGDRTQYTLVGNVQLTRELGRTWSAGLSASRSMQFDAVLRDITLTDAVSFGISGLLNQRVQVSTGVGASRGSVGFDQPDSGIISSSASASLQYGFTRHLSMGLQYAYYYSTYDSGVVLPPFWPRHVDRQSFSANLNFWLPLMQRTRRPNASR